MKSFRYIINQVLGQNTKDDPTTLMKEVGRGVFSSVFLPLIRGFKTDSGIKDGQNLGQKAEYLTATKLPLGQYRWDAPNGKQYHLAYESDGNGVDGAIKYWQTPVPTASGMAYTGTLISTLPTNIIPDFVDAGNGYLYAACGQAGIIKIYPVQAGTLTYTAVAGLPASSNIVLWRRRIWLAPMDETVIRWTPIGDYERLLPKLEEIEAGTYGIDRRITYQAQGVDGFTVGMFGCDSYLAVWTNRDMGIIIGNGESNQTSFVRCGKGYGMSGLKSYAYKDNILYWRSDYNGGTILGAVIGAIPTGGKLLTSVGAKEFTIHIFDAAELNKSEFVNTPLMDCKVLGVGVCDARGDWEDTFTTGVNGKIYANTALNTSLEPGYVQSRSAEAAQSYYPTIVGQDSDWTQSGLGNLNDGNPATNFSAVSAGHTILNQMTIQVMDASGGVVATSVEYVNPGTSWSGYRLFNIPQVSGVRFEFRNSRGKGLTIGGGFPTNIILKKITITNFLIAADSLSLTIGEIAFDSELASTTAITSQVFKVEGLTSANNALDANSRALARFYCSYIGTSADGTGLGTATGLNSESFSTVQVRGGASFAFDATHATKNWLNVTEAQLKTGYDLTGNAQFAPTAGVLYVQFRIPLQVINGMSPKIDAAGFYFWMGNNQKSINPMGYRDKNLLCCVRNNDLSAVPDKTLVLNNAGGLTSILGQHVTSFHNYRDKIYSAQGLRVAEYGEGIENRQTSTSQAVPLERRVRYPRISLPGRVVYPKTVNIKVDKYDLSTATPATSQAIYDALVNYTGMTSSFWAGKRCMAGYDGTVLTLILADVLKTSLHLTRTNRLTGNTTSTLLGTGAYAYLDYEMAMNDSKTKAYIVASAGTDTGDGRYLKYWVYDLVSDTITTAQTIVAAGAGHMIRSCSISLISGTMHIAYADGYTTTPLYHIYSTNYEDNSPTWSAAVAIETIAAATSAYLRIYKNYNNSLAVVYGVQGANTIKTRIYSGSWGSAVNLRTTAGAYSIAVLSHNGRDHCFIHEGASIYVWSSAGTWANTATITGVANPSVLDAGPYGASSIAVIWTDLTNLDYSTGFNATFTAKVDGSIPSVYAAFLSRNDTNRTYMISQTANSSLYTYYLSIFPLCTDPTGSLKCLATSGNGTHTVFERTTAISSPITLPRDGYFPDMGGCEYVDVELIGYGDTKITSSEMEIEYTED